MIDIALGKPLPNSTGLCSTDCQRSSTLGAAPHAAAVGDVSEPGRRTRVQRDSCYL